MKDPYANKFKNTIRDYRNLSDFATEHESWTLKAVVVKSNDDLRQEVLAMQLMKRVQQIFQEAD